jgi:hypothetical protein
MKSMMMITMMIMVMIYKSIVRLNLTGEYAKHTQLHSLHDNDTNAVTKHSNNNNNKVNQSNL